jgi:hypothetical protein
VKSLVKWAAVLALAALALVSCQKDKWAEPKKVMNDFIAMNGELGKSMDEADTGAEVAAALKAYVARAKVVGPQLEGLEDKYPELKNEETIPQEVKDLMQEVENSLQGMTGIFGKIIEFGEDPAVQAAMEEFQSI